MSLPAFMMAMVGNLAIASDLTITATVPAPIPGGAPTITQPLTNSTINASSVVVSGTCPVIIPAVVITIYDGTEIAGSNQCNVSGLYSVPISLSYGTHTLVATVVTITNQTGESSLPVTITRPAPPTPVVPPTNPVVSNVSPSATPSATPGSTAAPAAQLLRITTTDKYMILDPDGRVTWHGVFSGGTAPYTVRVNWGDGQIEENIVLDQTEQVFSHTYKQKETYDVSIQAFDATGITSSLRTTAITNLAPLGVGIAPIRSQEQLAPVLTFIQEHTVQIYIAAFSSLTFLWYLEHGRNLLGYAAVKIAKYFGFSLWHK